MDDQSRLALEQIGREIRIPPVAFLYLRSAQRLCSPRKRIDSMMLSYNMACRMASGPAEVTLLTGVQLSLSTVFSAGEQHGVHLSLDMRPERLTDITKVSHTGNAPQHLG